MATLTIAVISDPHFFLKDERSAEAHSYLPVSTDGDLSVHARGLNKNPIDDLKALIGENNLKADILLCPGDITTRANSTALRTGWATLVDVAHKLDATMLCAATGNHDVASRSQKDLVGKDPIRQLSEVTGPIEALKLLSPLYPACRRDPACSSDDSRVVQGKYFGESFAILDHDPRFRVLTFNSCSDHGHDAHEYERGTAPQSALRWVREDLAKLSSSKINLLLTHHPLVSQSAHDGDKYSFQAGGDHLLQVAEELGDDWLVINGHKHHGELKDGPSTTGVKLALFSAASFSVAMDSLLEGSDNQFYLIDLDRDHSERLVGTVRVWNWNVGSRWRKAPPRDDTGLFDGCGFGNSMTPKQLASELQRQYSSGISAWDDLRIAMPDLSFVLPGTLRKVRQVLLESHGLVIETDEHGFYVSISREAKI